MPEGNLLTDRQTDRQTVKESFKAIVYHGAIKCKDCLGMLKRAIYRFRVRYNLYHQVDLPPYDEQSLEEQYHYVDPCCVSAEYFYQHKETTVDVSIVVPLYNSIRYAKRIVKMFNNQKTDYTFEILLVNDGSKDNTYAVMKALIADKPNFVLYNKTNGGIADARNYGIEQCRGKYIGFFDHDDIVTNDYIQKLYNLAIKRNADIVLCQHGTITTDGIITRKGQSGGFIWGGIYRRDIFEHMRFPKNYWYEDMINGFLMKPQANQILEVKETLYYKETSAHNASKILWHNDNIKAIDQWYLTKSLVHSYYKLGLKDDELVFKLALNECSALMVSRIGGIDPALQMQVFMACSRFLQSLHQKRFHLSSSQKRFYMALKSQDFSLWKLLAKC